VSAGHPPEHLLCPPQEPGTLTCQGRDGCWARAGEKQHENVELEKPASHAGIQEQKAQRRLVLQQQMLRG